MRALPLLAHGRQYGWDATELSDLINPLKRYLRSCIGRPWNKVHSELSQRLDRRSVSGSHIWGHVMLEIETDCYVGPDRLVDSNNRLAATATGPSFASNASACGAGDLQERSSRAGAHLHRSPAFLPSI